MRWHAYQHIIILVPVTLLQLPLVPTEEWCLQGTPPPYFFTTLGTKLMLKSSRHLSALCSLETQSVKVILWFMRKWGECFFAHFSVNIYQICPKLTQEVTHFPSVAPSQRAGWETYASGQPQAALRLMSPFQHQGFLPGLSLSALLFPPLGGVPSRRSFSLSGGWAFVGAYPPVHLTDMTALNNAHSF